MEYLTTYLLVFIGCFSVMGFIKKRWYYSHLLYPYGITKYYNTYPILTNCFLHVNYLHLFMNVVILYIFGEELERVLSANDLGKYWLFILFFIPCIMASVVDFIFRRNDKKFTACGASHGTMGVLTAYLLLEQNQISNTFIQLGINNFIIIFTVVGLTLYKLYKKVKIINHLSHLIGLLTGGLIAIFIK